MGVVQILFYGSPQLINLCMHMKFQVNILSSSGIMRGDRPTDEPTDHPTLWIIGGQSTSKIVR